MFSTLPLDMLRLIVEVTDMRTRFVLPLVNKLFYSTLNKKYWLGQARLCNIDCGYKPRLLLYRHFHSGIPKIRSRVDGRQLSVSDWMGDKVSLFDVSQRGDTILHAVYIDSDSSCYVTWKGWICYLRSGVIDCRIHAGTNDVAVVLIHYGTLGYYLFDIHCMPLCYKETNIAANKILSLKQVNKKYVVLYTDQSHTQHALHFNTDTCLVSCQHTAIEESEFVCYVEPL